MLSIIICSVKEAYRSQIKKNIEATIGLKEYEVIVIENEVHKYSIAKAYNIAAAQAKFPFLCFIHEDILFHTTNWGSILLNNFKSTGARLIGVLGCTIKTKSPSSVYIFESAFNRQNQLQRYPDGKVVHCYENPLKEQVSEVCILDGLFIASTKVAWKETMFSEDYLNNFHGYDIDFSLKNFSLGKVVVVYDILLEHFSFGSFSKTWAATQMALTNRWYNQLPIAANVPRAKDKKAAERKNLQEFLKILVQVEFDKKVTIKYLIQYLKLAPFNSLNFFFIRQIFLGKQLDNRIKLLFKSSTHNKAYLQ